MSTMKKAASGPSEYWTPTEVATFLRVHKVTVYAWIRSGYLPAKNLRGRLRVDRQDAEALLHDRAEPVRDPRNSRISPASREGDRSAS